MECLANVKFRDEIRSIRKYIVNQMKNGKSDRMQDDTRKIQNRDKKRE